MRIFDSHKDVNINIYAHSLSQLIISDSEINITYGIQSFWLSRMGVDENVEILRDQIDSNSRGYR